MKNILVTGGAGFIGSNLISKLLNLGYKVINIDNFDSFYSRDIKENNIKDFSDNSNYKFYEINIENLRDLKKVFIENQIDVIVHLAAKTGVRESIQYPLEYVKTNILGTTNILELMKEYKVKKMVYASSSSVYGNMDTNDFSEDLKISKPISPYAATKAACEQFCYTYSKLYDLQILCLRFFTVYGPKQRPDLAICKFVNLIKENKAIPVYGDGTTMRDYTFIDDIVDGIVSSINYDKSQYEIINLGNSEPISLSEMIKAIEESLNKKALIDRKEMQSGDVYKTFADITKARKLLNFEPKITFSDGIKKFIEWHSKN